MSAQIPTPLDSAAPESGIGIGCPGVAETGLPSGLVPTWMPRSVARPGHGAVGIGASPNAITGCPVAVAWASRIVPRLAKKSLV